MAAVAGSKKTLPLQPKNQASGSVIGSRFCSRRGCGKLETISCEICWGPYCSRGCQLLDWSAVHKDLCKPIPGSIAVNNIFESALLSTACGLPKVIADARVAEFSGKNRNGSFVSRGPDFVKAHRFNGTDVYSENGNPKSAKFANPPGTQVLGTLANFSQPPPQIPPHMTVPPPSIPAVGQHFEPQKPARKPVVITEPPKVPEVFANLIDLSDLYAPNEEVEAVITYYSPISGVFWGYLVPLFEGPRRKAFDDVWSFIQFLHFESAKWRPLKSVRFGERIMYREKGSSMLFRATVIGKDQESDSTTVFCEDFGIVSSLKSNYEVADLGKDRSFPALAFAFVNIPTDLLDLFKAEVRLTSGERKIRGKIAKGSDGDLVVTLGESVADRKRFSARDWADYVGVAASLDHVPRTPQLKAGAVTDAEVSYYSPPDPVIYCYEKREIESCRTLTDGVMEAMPRMKGLKLGSWKVGEVGICEDNYNTAARFVVKEIIDEENLKVFFFDFGDTDVRNVGTCRPMTMNLVERPIRLITFVLDCGGKKMSKEAIDYAYSFCDGIAAVKLHTRRISPDGHPIGDVVPADKTNLSFLEFLRLHPRRLMWQDDVTYKSFPVGEIVSVTPLDASFGLPDVFDFAGVILGPVDRIHEQGELDARVDKHGQADGVEHVPVEGELVLAKDEGIFYRAVAVDETKVWFLDYGNATSVVKADVRRMPENFLQIPPFAHVFRFSDSCNLTQEEKSFRIAEMMKSGKVKAQIVRRSKTSHAVYVDVLGIKTKP